MKYRLYLEVSRLNQLESNKTSTDSSKAHAVPAWLQWLWQHRSGGAMANVPFDKLEEEQHQPFLPLIVLYESSKPQEYDRIPINQGHILVLDWNGLGSDKTLRIRHKSQEQTWSSSSDPADILKAIRQSLRHCSHAAKSIKRTLRLRNARLSEEQIVTQFCHLVETHFADSRCSIPQLANLCGINNVRLQQICQQHLNMGPKAYLIQYRINKACEIIMNWPENRRCMMSKIAESTGFASPSYFAALFMAQKGQTPTEFRHLHLQRGR